MTEVLPTALEEFSINSDNKRITDYKLGISNIIYQVAIAKDGDSWCALIGQDLQNGISGFGKTVQEALYDLANQINQLD